MWNNESEKYNFLEKGIETLIFCGDIHGAISELVDTINKFQNTAVVVAGDVGLGFYKVNYYVSLFQKLQKKLSLKNNYLFLVRGNHDNGDYFNNLDEVSSTIAKNYSNIIICADYKTFTIKDKVILPAGGARSVDKSIRMAYNPYSQKFEACGWWANEKFNYQPISNGNIDIVVTHSAPSMCLPYGNNEVVEYYALRDPSLISDLENERKDLDKLYERLNQNGCDLSYWIYGHYHCHYESTIKKTQFLGLDMYDMSRNGKIKFDFFEIV